MILGQTYMVDPECKSTKLLTLKFLQPQPFAIEIFVCLTEPVQSFSNLQPFPTEICVCLIETEVLRTVDFTLHITSSPRAIQLYFVFTRRWPEEKSGQGPVDSSARVSDAGNARRWQTKCHSLRGRPYASYIKAQKMQKTQLSYNS